MPMEPGTSTDDDIPDMPLMQGNLREAAEAYIALMQEYLNGRPSKDNSDNQASEVKTQDKKIISQLEEDIDRFCKICEPAMKQPKGIRSSVMEDFLQRVLHVFDHVGGDQKPDSSLDLLPTSTPPE
ncbi:hypothetical protein CCHR01_13108 [Colletotrichum chrysophilum]|uniref:Uncharacterized protein n=2 Tax=Colletotrichum gloeosporioides species complex TaxID=2707338 RepID=L2FS71_COLFN|nr:hypothetical protein CCHR01_13108 [Colletotrichum chrysophilum]